MSQGGNSDSIWPLREKETERQKEVRGTRTSAAAHHSELGVTENGMQCVQEQQCAAENECKSGDI